MDIMIGFDAAYLYYFATGMGLLTGFAFGAILYRKK